MHFQPLEVSATQPRVEKILTSRSAEETEQIAADRYLAAKQAVKSKRRGLQFNKLLPPGASQ